MAKKSAAAAQRDAEQERGAGDNVLGPAGQEQLRALQDRVMNLLDDRDDVNADISEVYAEAREGGFDVKTLRKAIAKRRAINKDPAAARAAEELLDLYFDALSGAPAFEPLNPGLAEQRKEQDEFEASEAELAAQRGRPQPEDVI
jgi:uncharacterized protein (UPF0335 family)